MHIQFLIALLQLVLHIRILLNLLLRVNMYLQDFALDLRIQFCNQLLSLYFDLILLWLK